MNRSSPASSSPMSSQSILLTGFGPFPGVTDNVSGALALAVRDQACEIPAITPRQAITADILPTEWHGAPERLDNLLNTVDPQIVLHFGVSGQATGFVIETVAENLCRDAPDAVGCPPPSPNLCAESPSALPSTLPVNAIIARLSTAGLPAATSNDAGAYLCNAVLFRSLRWARQERSQSQRKIGFVHIPEDPERAGLTFEALVAGAGLIVSACLLASSHDDNT